VYRSYSLITGSGNSFALYGRTIASFYPILDSVLYDLKRLQWVDLSHNYLERLDYDFQEIPDLKTLYLHENYLFEISDLEKVESLMKDQLTHLPLRSLSLHGNPLDQIPNFRGYVISKLPHLQRMDSVLISKKERDNANYMLNCFKYPLKPIKDPAKPPAKVTRKKQD
jgi:Leucine-rich repeat (LRR) protein